MLVDREQISLKKLLKDWLTQSGGESLRLDRKAAEESSSGKYIDTF